MSQNPWYAGNARNLLDMRRQGMRPERPVNVSLIGPLCDDLTLFVRDGMPADRLEWRMLVNLDVIVWADPTVPFDRLTATLLCIAKARPAELQLCFLHGGQWHQIDCGTGMHLPTLGDAPPIHFFHWLPINTGGTPIGARLNAAVRKTHQPGAIL